MKIFQWMVVALAAFSVACGSDESSGPTLPEKSEFNAGKSDVSPDRVCAEYGLEAGCDICFEQGWYDDGECDSSCRNRDVDCFEFAPTEDPRVFSCKEPEFGSRLLIFMTNTDPDGEWIEEPWPEGASRDLIIEGSGDAGTYEQVCTLDLAANEIICDFGIDEEVRVSLEVQREEVCSTQWEDTDISLYLEGSYDGGLFSGTREIRCSLDYFEHQNPC